MRIRGSEEGEKEQIDSRLKFSRFVLQYKYMTSNKHIILSPEEVRREKGVVVLALERWKEIEAILDEWEDAVRYEKELSDPENQKSIPFGKVKKKLNLPWCFDYLFAKKLLGSLQMFSEKISCASTQHSMSYKPRDGRRSTSARLRGLPMDIASALAGGVFCLQ